MTQQMWNRINFKSAVLLKQLWYFCRKFSQNLGIEEKKGKAGAAVGKTVFPILFAIAFAHFMNDLLQIIIPSIYPVLKEKYSLSFSQIGMITFVYQITASLLQPVVGNLTDKKPLPFSLAIGMCFTLAGICLLAFANSFSTILIS